jgi:hypothetical protein
MHYKNPEEYSGLIRTLFRIPFSMDIEALGIGDKEVKIKSDGKWLKLPRKGAR